MTINPEIYRQWASSFTPKEIVKRRLILEWLPEEIVDCHAHCNLSEHVGVISQRVQSHMMSSFPWFSLEQSEQLHELFFPGKAVRAVRFPLPFRGIDHKAANQYLLENSPVTDRVALYGIPMDIDYTVVMLHHPRVAALKMYYLFFEPPAEKIYQYFPPEVLAIAQELDIPIILHLPRMITACADDLRQVIKDFPHLRIVLAHLGLPHLPVPGLEESYQKFSKADSVFMDSAMVPSKEVIALATKAFGTRRIMFGSDEPLNMIRAVVYQHPVLGQRLASSLPYHWVDSKERLEYGHLAVNAIHLHWQALSAWGEFLHEEFGRRREVIADQIFRQNAAQFFGFDKSEKEAYRA